MAVDFIGTANTLSDVLDDLQQLQQNIRTTTERITGQPFPTGPVKPGVVPNPKMIIWEVTGIAEQLEIPDLAMAINPRNLSSKYSQLINRKRTIGGFIEEHWGEQLDDLSASGITASFIGERGLTNYARRDTDAFREFMEFVDIYRNNGSIYDTKTGQIVAQGSIVMNYDGSVFHGYFENFTIRETAVKQYDLEYDFTFKVTYEEFPGRKLSFKDITTVRRPGSPANENSTLSYFENQTQNTNGQT